MKRVRERFEEVRRSLCVSPLFGILAVAFLLSPALSAALEFERGAILGGEWWRIVTCHWTHPGIAALLWDTAAFVVLGTLLECWDRSRFVIVIVAAALLIPLGLLMLAPELGVYRGLSGIDAALFTASAMALVADAARTRDRRGFWIVVVAMTGFAAKVAWELASGDSLFARDLGGGFVVEPLAHLLGGLVGMLVFVPRRVVRQTQPSTGSRPLRAAFRRAAECGCTCGGSTPP